MNQPLLKKEQVMYLEQGLKGIEARVLDPVTINVGVAIFSFKKKNIPPHFQAGFFPHKLEISQELVLKYLSQDAKSDTDKLAVASLQKYGQHIPFLSYGFSETKLASNDKVELLDQRVPFFVNKNNTKCNRVRSVPSANLKAMDPQFSFKKYGNPDKSFVLNVSDQTIILDGIIFLNSDYSYQYDNAKTNTNYDASAVFNHELLGIMGLQATSIITLQSRSLPDCKKEDNYTKCLTKANVEQMALGSISDLFRYSKRSAKLHIVDWAVKSEINDMSLPYFSIDGGKTPVMYFSFGGYNSHEQAGVWANSEELQKLNKKGVKFLLNINQEQFGLNSPINGPNFKGDLTQADLIALDAIGWDVKLK